MEKKYLKVGTYVPETEEKEAVIQREYYRQGWIFKDEEAFLSHADQVCYVPELSDGAYTRQDFMALCNGQEDFATECFRAVDWQCPGTWVDEQYREDEWGYCPVCGKIYDMAGEVCACPVCGWNPEEAGENGDSEGGCRAAEPGGVQPEAGLEAGG
jgi:hypothetical protein